MSPSGLLRSRIGGPLRDQFVALAAALRLPIGDDPLPAVLSELHRRGHWLLIFDNAEEPSALAPGIDDQPFDLHG